mgnify:CR=1 FL=1
MNLSDLLENLMKAKEVSIHDVADTCNVTYQTVKNILDGKSPNARFVKKLIESFGIDQDLELLRKYLLAYLLLQFPEESGKLLRRVSLMPD